MSEEFERFVRYIPERSPADLAASLSAMVREASDESSSFGFRPFKHPPGFARDREAKASDSSTSDRP